tara:strand:+ start:2550 stop:3893 length:1344 start_codon:yes stop_codon:yes gene_type:complete
MFNSKTNNRQSNNRQSNIKYERLPNILESDNEGPSFKFIKNKNVNKIVSGVCEMKNYDIDSSSSNYKHLSFYDSNSFNIYDGAVNIWINKKDLFKFPKNFDVNKIDIFSCLYGYCLVSRSKVFNNISLQCFRDLFSNKITNENCHTFCEGDVLLAKMLHWKKFIPCTILKVNDKIEYGSENNVDDLSYFGESTFNVVFPCCPDSEIYLAWHNHNTIVQNKSVLSYPKKNFLEEMEEVDVIFDDNSSDDSDDDIENILDNIISEVIGEVISGEKSCNVEFGNNSYGDGYRDSPSSFTDTEYIITGVVDKKVIGKEILKFNTYWIKNNTYNSIEKFISKKSVTISATEFSENLSKSFLPNVCVLENYEMEHILKIQELNGYGCKFFNWDTKYEDALYNNKLEPQEYNFFKFSSNPVIKDYLSRNKGVTFTGALCDIAKKYLFNITNSRF